MRTMCLVVKWTADAVGLVQLIYCCTFFKYTCQMRSSICTFGNFYFL